MADIKHECSQLAHEGAQRVAMAGFGVLCGWWYLVYRLTFETDRVGSNGTCDISRGSLNLDRWLRLFLYHNREVFYRSAMNFTILKR